MIEVTMQESRRYVIKHGRRGGRTGCKPTELISALNRMPCGWIIQSLENRDDGTTIIVAQAERGEAVPPCDPVE
jgi:hypothetical protein